MKTRKSKNKISPARPHLPSITTKAAAKAATEIKEKEKENAFFVDTCSF
jgi:hypothetical protein